MVDIITQQKLNNLDRDISDADKALNTKAVVTPRYGASFKSLPLAIQEVIETGGFEPFATEAALIASRPVLTKKASIALDTFNIWIWENNAWINKGSVVNEAKKYTDSVSKKNVVAASDDKTSDASKNIFNKDADILGYFVTDALSSTPGVIKVAENTRLHRLEVKEGETYLFSATMQRDVLAIAFSADSNFFKDKVLEVAKIESVSQTVKKVVVPSGANYLFFNTSVPALNFDVTSNLIVNKFKGKYLGFGEALVADEYARNEIKILEREALKDSDLNLPDVAVNLAVNKVSGFYIYGSASSSHGKVAAAEGAEIQKIPVVEGVTYAIYSSNFTASRFTLAVSDSEIISAGKQLTPLSLVDTQDSNVKLFTVPSGYSFAFATTCIPALSYDIRDGFWVNTGNETTKFTPREITEIKGYDIRDTLAQERLDNLSIKNTSILKGKKWIAIGDSITAKNTTSNVKYHDYINTDVGGMIIYNKGIGGTGFHDRMNVAETLTEEADYITVFLGTNDFGLNRNSYPLGEFLSTDTENISGRMNKCLGDLVAKYPLAKIAVISALPRLTNYGSNASPNSVGYTLKQHVEMLEMYAEHYSLPFLNMYKQSNLPVWIPSANAYYFTAPGQTSPDGLHPNDLGHRVIADKIKAFLESI